MCSTVLAKGDWLSLHRITYRNAKGELRNWECVRRRQASGAASIIATVERAGEPCLVVVKQYRPPVDAWVLELPAGLIDPGETAAAAAVRELGEETGFHGAVVDAGPFVHNSPGLTDEKTALVYVVCSEQRGAMPDADESIEVLLLPLRGLKARLLEEERQGARLDAKLWCFALGLEFGRGADATGG